MAVALVAAAPVASATFERATESWGLDFVHAGDELDDPSFPEIMGSGACVFDYDGDGWDDLFIGNGRFNDSRQDALDPRSALYRNVAGASFVRVPGELDVSAFGMGCAAGDFDGDGDPDLAYSTWGAGTMLFRNDGGTFTNVTSQAGFDVFDCGLAACFGASLAWFDYDLDADLDLYVTNYLSWPGFGPSAPLLYPGQCNVLWRNDGDGSLTNVTAAAGAADCGSNHLGLAIADVDGDGWQDVYIASDETANALLMNNRDGTFTDRAVALGVNDTRGGMGTAFADYDGDGLLDLTITNFAAEGYALYTQQPDGSFVDRALEAGLGWTWDFVGWGTDFQDLDLDGDLDLVFVNGNVNANVSWFDIGDGGERPPRGERDLVYRNDGGRSFANVTGSWWTPAERKDVGRGLAFGDFDADGAVDAVIVSNENETAEFWRGKRTGANFVTVSLTGGDAVNPDALGAVVTVRAGAATWQREVVSAASYLSQSTRDLAFGLAEATRVDSIDVRWPDGRTDTFGPFDANVFVTVTRDGATVERTRPLVAASAGPVGLTFEPVALEATVLVGSAPATFTWTVDGTTLNGATAEWTPTRPGAFDATVRVAFDDGTWDSATVRIDVANRAPTATFTAPATADRVADVTFDGTASTDPDGAVVAWAWTVDGVTLTGATITHRFTSLGDAVVTLTVTDDHGGTATTTRVVAVLNVAPQAAAGPDRLAGVGSVIAFDGTASTDADGTVTAWAWDFGDGTSSAAATPTFTVTAPGDRTVTLTVTDDDGASAVDDAALTVIGHAPDVVLVAPATATRGASVTLDGASSSDADGPLAAWAWDVAGTAASGAAVDWVFDALGAHAVTLTVTDADGVTAQARTNVQVVNAAPTVAVTAPTAREGLGVVTFTATGNDPDGPLAAPTWTFSDGGSATGWTVDRTFTTFGHHTAKATVTDADGATATGTATVWVYAIPVARFDAPESATRLDTVAFDAAAASDADGTVTAWAWDFGDGATATGSHVTHRFTTLGAHSVTLTVTDADGFTGTTSGTVAIVNVEPSVTAPPTMDHEGLDAVTILFEGADPDGDVVAWAWDFGDGNTGACSDDACTSPASELRLSHPFANHGTFSVTATATDDDGATATATTTVNVFARPVARFSAPLTADRVTAVTFDARASFDPDGEVVAWAWDFGDGATATGDVVTHHFQATGARTVRLQVTDDDGRRATATAVVHVVNLPPTADLAGGTVANVGQAVRFDASRSRDADGTPLTWRWVVDGAFVGDAPTLDVAFADLGLRTVTVTVTDSDGATATAGLLVDVTDVLTVTVDTDRGTYAPTESVAGNVTVRFANGEPVPNALVTLQAEWRAEAAPQAFVTREPVTVTTGPDGTARYALKPLAAVALDGFVIGAGPPTQVASLPLGRERVDAAATWQRNDGAASAAFDVALVAH